MALSIHLPVPSCSCRSCPCPNKHQLLWPTPPPYFTSSIFCNAISSPRFVSAKLSLITLWNKQQFCSLVVGYGSQCSTSFWFRLPTRKETTAAQKLKLIYVIPMKFWGIATASWYLLQFQAQSVPALGISVMQASLLTWTTTQPRHTPSEGQSCSNTGKILPFSLLLKNQ